LSSRWLGCKHLLKKAPQFVLSASELAGFCNNNRSILVKVQNSFEVTFIEGFVNHLNCPLATAYYHFKSLFDSVFIVAD
jgi:hypothetical protein